MIDTIDIRSEERKVAMSDLDSTHNLSLLYCYEGGPLELHC